MDIIFDLISGREQDDRIEYTMRNISFIPRKGETIDIDNGHLKGQFKVYDVEYSVSETEIEKKYEKTGEARLKYIRVRAKKQ